MMNEININIILLIENANKILDYGEQYYLPLILFISYIIYDTSNCMSSCMATLLLYHGFFSFNSRHVSSHLTLASVQPSSHECTAHMHSYYFI